MSVLAPQRSNAVRGIVLMLLATFLFTLMDAMAKWAMDRYSIVQIVFFRSLFAFVPLSVVLFRNGLAGLRTRNPLGHIGRSVVGIAALCVFFLSFKLMPLAEAYAISFAVPLFVTALSVPLLGERVGARRWTAVVVGFIGVLVMVQPGVGVFEPVALLPLLGAVLYAFVVIIIRILARTETSVAIVFYFTVTAGIFSGLALPLFWRTPDLLDLMVLAAIGIVGGCAQLTITGAFRAADISIVIPFEYTAILWAVLVGYLVWSDVPGLNIWVGVLIVSVSAPLT